MKPRLSPLSVLLTLTRKNHTLACNHVVIETHKPAVSSLSSGTWRAMGEAYSAMDAYDLFDEMPDLDVVSATKMMGRFARQQRHKEVVPLFSRMLFLNVRPSEFTFGTVLHSSTALKDLNLGMQFHACALKMGLHSIVFVGSALLNFYSKLSSMEEAGRAFEDMWEPNVVSYTTLIHGLMKKGSTEEALRLFREMPERNAASWNAVIGGFSQMGHNEKAVNLFVEMGREGLMPDVSTFPSAIIAAANIAALEMGRSFHACALKRLGNLDVMVANSLISFYAKCGGMEDSLLVFDELSGRSIVSWNAVIFGFAQNGRGKDAVNFFERMRTSSGLRPNSVTLLGLLAACNHAGLVGEGYSYFNQARLQSPSLLKPEHYACMVDLLARCGRFEEARKFLQDLRFDPGIGFWKALLGGCHIHSNMELGELAAQKILALDPEDASSYIMLSKAHSSAGRWQNVLMLRKEMKEKGMKRVPGCSWIEVRSKVHVFVNYDTKHQQNDEIYTALNFCTQQIGETEASNCFLTENFFYVTYS